MKNLTWRIKNSNTCNYCKGIDTIEHHLFDCPESKQFWNKVAGWLTDNIDIHFNFTICEIIFGIPSNENPDIDVINFLIIMGKWYINKAKSEKEPLYFLNFLTLIKNKIETIVQANQIQNRSNREWQDKMETVTLL